jgi:hypothetical protein
MEERYRLVFRGELLEGQHRAVVKRRLTELMQLSETQVEKLFSGAPVILRSDVDRKTAAKYQTLFKQAGGRLQVLVQRDAEPELPAAAPARGRTGAGARTAGGDAPAFTVLNNYAPPPEAPRTEIDAPDYDVAAVGTALSYAVPAMAVDVPDPDFELAEVGADLLTEPRETVVVEVREVDFEVAEVGATIGDASPEVAVEPPDISHLKLVEN